MALSAEQMAAMSALLDQALGLDAAGRERWLGTLGPQHRELEPALRQALLGGEAGLGTTPRLADLDPTALAGGLTTGERVGPYLLVRPLGQGGMAQVWLARRADGAYQREVALKLPATVLRQDLASRFARERDILAKLEHPNIARLYDAGVSGQSQPYLAMEFVAGEPLNGWCDAQRLGVRERLKLFLQVLDAVQYAHGQQVIHRDLKPSNILVTGSGQVRLLDFGVAKLLAQSDDATQLTQIYGQALTPQYASPEQLRGDEVTAASDVYSLGVLLYELLTGSPPYRVKAGASARFLEQAIVTAQVEPPSTRVGQKAALARTATASQLARHLQGDLDAIVLKALAKDLAERYATATALAEDLRRYLTGEPVLARPYTPLYRLIKFVQRHRGASAATSLVALLLAVALGLSVSHRTSFGSAPEATADSAFPPATGSKSIAVLPFVDMSETHDQEYFSDGLSEELIDRLAHSPDLKVISRTSSFYFKGKNEDARLIASKLGVANLLEGSVRKAGNELRVAVQLVRATDGTYIWSQTYAGTLSDIFKLQDEIAGTVAQALKVALNGSPMRAGTVEANADAYNLVLQARYLVRTKSRQNSDKAIGILKRAIKINPNSALAWSTLGTAHYNRADYGWTEPSNALADAKAALKRALQIDPALVPAHYTLAGIYMSTDWNWAAARAEIEQMRKIDPQEAFMLPSLSAELDSLLGRLDEAIETTREILTRNPLDAYLLSNLAALLDSAGRFEESVTTSLQLLQLNPKYAGARSALGIALLDFGQNSQALAEIEKETDELQRILALPIAYWAVGRHADSDAALRQLEKTHAEDAAYNIAEIRAYRGEADAAFAWLERAYRQRDTGMPGIKTDSLLRNLHQDPRFQALLVKMKLAD